MASPTTMKRPNPPDVGFGDLPDDAMQKLAPLADKQVLVTGGCGFLGRHIVELLLEVGAHVRVFDLNVTKFSEKVKFVAGDLTRQDDIDAACEDCWVVFHCASPSPLSRNAKLFNAVNIGGTQNVLAACRRAGVERLVYTSSASIIFDGTDQRNLDERVPFPEKSLDAYTYSKLLAEKAALEGTDSLSTPAIVAIRPHSIFGPRDPNFVPQLAKAGRGGKSRYIIGNGKNYVDFTYVGNVVYAHLLAAVHLTRESRLNGQAYFITNNHPVLFWDFVGEIQVGLGYTKPWLKLPYSMMWVVAFILTAISARYPSFKPLFNMQSVTYAGCHHYYSSEKAWQHFGYSPPIQLMEAKRRNLEYFSYLHCKYDENDGGMLSQYSRWTLVLMFMVVLFWVFL